MIFEQTAVAGAFVIEVEAQRDERGFFARVWCEQELARHGLDPALAQAGISFNRRAGTLRGLHFQAAPHEEVKLVRCTRGAIHDVVLDLRVDSPSAGKWAAVELTADNRRSLYIPKGVAHGFQTLTDETEVLYLLSVPYVPGAARGVRFDDPAFGISWPREVTLISERDASWPDFAAAET
jgi:dTDP-4-dehydrorhamnose 3,5-epimerase